MNEVPVLLVREGPTLTVLIGFDVAERYRRLMQFDRDAKGTLNPLPRPSRA